MTRLARRRPLTIAAATLAVLVAPAAANAASTYTVKAGDGACGGSDLACGTLADAATAATPGDVFDVAPGAYEGATFTTGGVTINGDPAGVLATSTLTFSGAAGGVSKLNRVNVAIGSGTGSGVEVTGAAGLEFSDAAVISANGHGILVTAGTASKIQRALVSSGGIATSAIRVESAAGSTAKALTVDSTIATGVASSVGVVTTSGALVGQAAGAVALTLRHLTAAGSTNGIALDASKGANLLNLGAGSITATLTNSIALNNVTSVATLGANSATLTIPGGDKTITSAPDLNAIFADAAARNFRLRFGSTAIGLGGVVGDESTKDFDGEDRGTTTDLGGDEFNNAPPVAKIVVATKTPRATQPVTFDASTSVDREAKYGGGIAAYQWTYSDGKTETTAGPTTTHVFEKEGPATASLVVVDKQQAASAPATASLNLINGTPPAVGIARPKNNAKVKQFTVKKTTKTVNGKKRTTTKRTRTKIVIGGLSADANGVASVILTIEKTAAAGATGAKASQAAAPKKCNWYNASKGFVRKSCTSPTLLTAKLKKDSKTGEWTYTIKRNLAKGTYKVSAVGVDKTGAFGNSAGKVGVVKFQLV